MATVAELQNLIRVFDRYELADRKADLLKTRFAYANSCNQYSPLIAAARACGWSVHDGETAHTFAKRMIAAFECALPAHAAEARSLSGGRADG